MCPRLLFPAQTSLLGSVCLCPNGCGLALPPASRPERIHLIFSLKPGSLLERTILSSQTYTYIKLQNKKKFKKYSSYKMLLCSSLGENALRPKPRLHTPAYKHAFRRKPVPYAIQTQDSILELPGCCWKPLVYETLSWEKVLRC